MSTGIRIKISRVTQEEHWCVYEYRLNGEGEPGRLRIRTTDGKVEVVARIPGEPSDNRFAGRASNKLYGLFKEGVLLDETWFNS